jgi:ribosomal protein L11 methyltransferase
MSNGPLTRFDITLDHRDDLLEEEIESWLWERSDGLGFERSDAETQTPAEMARHGPRSGVLWRLHLPLEGEPQQLQRQFTDSLPAHWGVCVEAVSITDHSYLTNYLEYFKPAQVSDRLMVHPPWEKPATDLVLVEIDPGMAFGTGTHQTTRLCMRGIDRLFAARGPCEVLDVGTGSGILAIAAVKIGSPSALAIDNDPVAVTAAIENLERNAVADRVVAATTPIEEVDRSFSLVIANILAVVIRQMRDELIRVTRPGGTLLLSGILAGEREAVEEVFVAAGCRLVGHEIDGEWCSISIERPQ